jgi:ribosome-associated protein
MAKKITKNIAIETARLIDSKKGENVRIIDLRKKSSLCDFVVLATALAPAHLEALEQEVSFELKKDGIYKINRDGGDTNTWRVSDYGGFMLHLLTKPTRDYYALDDLFGFGDEIPWWDKKPTDKIVKKNAKKTSKAKASASETGKKRKQKKE